MAPLFRIAIWLPPVEGKRHRQTGFLPLSAGWLCPQYSLVVVTGHGTGLKVERLGARPTARRSSGSEPGPCPVPAPSALLSPSFISSPFPYLHLLSPRPSSPSIRSPPSSHFSPAPHWPVASTAVASQSPRTPLSALRGAATPRRGLCSAHWTLPTVSDSVAACCMLELAGKVCNVYFIYKNIKRLLLTPISPPTFF